MMATKRLYATIMVIPLLLTATSLCGQQAVAESGSASSKSITELQQDLARSRAELETNKRYNLKLAEQRRELEAEVARLRKQLLEQEQSALAVSQSSAPTVEQEQPAAE